MSTAVTTESRIDRVEVTDETITAYLVDGRVVSVPGRQNRGISRSAGAPGLERGVTE